MAIVTLCFVKKDNKILMINRNKPPFMGMWNALGGHLENNETPKECAIREIYEESNVKVDNAELISISTWNYDDDEIYVYVSNLSDDFDISSYPIKINEGIIDFKDIDWIIHEKNYGVIADLRVFLKDIKENQKNNYHLVYDESKLVEYIKK
jgi:8-oxo-dGTP diphosphatase